MFEKPFEERMAAWRDFRDSLEESEDPLRQAVSYYRRAPLVSIHTDPWDQKTWPGPWELLYENQYCEFCTVLGLCYSLQLTDRFKDSHFEIHISKDNSKSAIYYLLYVDDIVINFDEDTIVAKENLPDTLYSQRIYSMQKLH